MTKVREEFKRGRKKTANERGGVRWDSGGRKR